MIIRVGFGVTVLAKARSTGGIDGIGTYTKELLDQFSRLGGQIEAHPFTMRIEHSPNLLEGKHICSLGNFKAQVLASTVLGTSFFGSGSFTQNLDLVHATDHYIPKIKDKPMVATLMDAIPLSNPEWIRSDLRRAKGFFWKKTAHWADKIITISEFSKREISHYFDIPLDKIVSIPLGVDDRWYRSISQPEITNVLNKYDLQPGFFLFVGTLQPRKNVQRAIEAYMSISESIKKTHPFVIVGRMGWESEELCDAFRSNKYGSSVRWLNHVSGDELFAILKSAKALVFPTLFEGFGLPVLEAFAAGLPVISSNLSSIPEVAGDAAILVDPYNPQSIANAMTKLSEDKNLSLDLTVKGLSRARKFTWKRTALETLKIYRQMVS